MPVNRHNLTTQLTLKRSQREILRQWRINRQSLTGVRVRHLQTSGMQQQPVTSKMFPEKLVMLTIAMRGITDNRV